MLQHQHHGRNELWRIAPVAPRIEVAQVQGVLQARQNTRYRACHFARNKRLTPPGRIVDPAAAYPCVERPRLSLEVVEPSIVVVVQDDFLDLVEG